MNRKGPRLVTLEEGEEIDDKTFEDLYNHARNSAIWYATNSSKSSFEIKEKLYKKGYPKDSIIHIKHDNTKEEVNIVDSVIESLESALYIDDLLFAERYAESKKRQRFGRSRVAMELERKGLDGEDVEEILDQVYEDASDELKQFVSKTYFAEVGRVENHWKLKQKVVQKAAARGWDFGDAIRVLDEIIEESGVD